MEAWVLPIRAGPFYDEKNITMLGPCSISQQQKDNNIHDRVSHSHRGPNTQPSVLPFCRCLVLPSCPGSTIALWFTGMHPVFQCIYSVYIYIPWASTTIKIMVDPISMIKTLGYAMVVILTPIVLMVVGIPGYIYIYIHTHMRFTIMYQVISQPYCNT